MDPNPVHVASVEDLKESLNFLEICEENVYELIVEGISPYIRKDDTGKENPITPDQQLSIVLRLFLHGQDLTALETITKISQPVLQTIIQDVSASILLAFADDYMLDPAERTDSDWTAIAMGFEEKAGFPHCLGAIDAKHIAIERPPEAGWEFFNRERFDSLVLMAGADSDHRFIFAECGSPGRNRDTFVLDMCKFWSDLTLGRVRLPGPPKEADLSEHLPFTFIGDEAFKLKLHEHFIQPYTGDGLTPERKMYNEMLSRAREYVETTFRMFVAKFKVLEKPFSGFEVMDINHMVLAMCVLHNILRTHSPSYNADNLGDEEINYSDKYRELSEFSGMDFDDFSEDEVYENNEGDEDDDWYDPYESDKEDRERGQVTRELFVRYANFS